jgi:PAS domain S-box-containing protein
MPAEDTDGTMRLHEHPFDAVKLLNSIGDACYILDHDWRFIFLNNHAEQLVHRTRAELIGKSVWAEFPEAVGSGFDRQYRRAISEGIPTAVEEYYAPLDTWFNVRAFPFDGGVAVIFQDIDERKRAEQSVQKRTTTILESITDAFFSLDSAWCFTYVNDQSERVLFRSREDLLGRSLWDAFPATVGSAFQDNYVRAIEEQVTVTFEAYYPPLDAWFDVRAYPSDGGLSVFYQDVTKRRKEQETLLRSREDLQLAVDGARLGTFYCDYPLDKIIWNHTCKEHFYLPHDAEVDFRLFYSLLHPEDREATRQAIELAEAERIAYDVEYRTLAANGRTRWVNAVGRFYYGSDGNPIRFDGITIDISARKAAEDALRQKIERESLLNRIGHALRSSKEPEQVLAVAVREVGQALNADRCYYATYDLDADIAVIGADWYRGGLASIAGQYRMSDFTINRDPSYKAGHTQVVDDTAEDAAIQALRLTSVVRVPLVSGSTMTTLSVAMSDGTRHWSVTEVQLLESVATFTQAALQSVRVSAREHRIAQQLQDALQPALPAQIPNLLLGHHSQPALTEAQVGGDFYDVFALDPNNYAVVIGDVSGKGLAAAQQLALIRNTLRTFLYLHRTPALAASALNEIVIAHDLLVGFVTCWVGVYNAPTGEVRYCCCGHEPPLLLREDGTIETLSTTGLPLGVALGSDYGDVTLSLHSGDTLLLYTDGISEAGPEHPTQLGTDGLISLFSSLLKETSIQTMAEAVIEKVQTYAGAFRDDVAVLLCRRQ